MADTHKSKKATKKEIQQNALHESYMNSECIVIQKQYFLHDISSALHNAWVNRNSEYHLYGLYNHIQAANCATLRHPGSENVVAAACPQTLFGTLDAPNGASSLEIDRSTLLEHHFPDHARILIYGGKDGDRPGDLPANRSLIDFWEIKALNTAHPWLSPAGSEASLAIMKSSFEQVYDSAMAAFAHNPEWQKVYALLIVGPYFTQVFWKERPPIDVLTPIPELPPVPNAGEPQLVSEVKAAALVAALDRRLALYEARPMPTIVYYNEAAFSSQSPTGCDWYKSISIEPKFLYSLALPVTDIFPDLVRQPSWFDHKRGDTKPRGTVPAITHYLDLQREICTKFVEICKSEQTAYQDLLRQNMNAPESRDSAHSEYNERPNQRGGEARQSHIMTRAAAARADREIEDALNLLARV